ncbi:MAG: hypothetical protein AAF939_18915, partial [Planctomycetota bacterium]
MPLSIFHPFVYVLQLVLCLLFVNHGFTDEPVASDSKTPTAIKALIIDGQNNHNAWPKTTVMMEKYL